MEAVIVVFKETEKSHSGSSWRRLESIGGTLAEGQLCYQADIQVWRRVSFT